MGSDLLFNCLHNIEKCMQLQEEQHGAEDMPIMSCKVNGMVSKEFW